MKFARTAKSYFYVEYLQGVSVYSSSDPKRALKISNALFNASLAMSSQNDFFIKNNTAPNETTWVAIAGFKNQDSCSAIEAKFN